jgi:hypothetical protein
MTYPFSRVAMLLMSRLSDPVRSGGWAAAKTRCPARERADYSQREREVKERKPANPPI